MQAMGQGTCATALKVMRATLIYPMVAKVSISSNKFAVDKSLEIKISNCRNNFPTINYSQICHWKYISKLTCSTYQKFLLLVQHIVTS